MPPVDRLVAIDKMRNLMSKLSSVVNQVRIWDVDELLKTFDEEVKMPKTTNVIKLKVK